MPDIVIMLIVCISAGMLAGLSTGFAGLSAAVFITPFLVSFLKVRFFEATAIALASDVLGSLISTIIFKRNKHVQFRKSLPLFIPVILGCIGGSIASYFVTIKPVGNNIMSYVTMAGTFALGLRFIIKPIQEHSDKKFDTKWQLLISILMGLGIGFICGFQGAGGGVMILFGLTMILHYEFKNAIGTSVLIMTFTALIGAISHVSIDFIDNQYFGDWQILIACVVSTTVFAAVAAKLANKVSPAVLNRIVGVMLVLSSLTTIIFKIVTR
ncbi:MAG: sulfite exporter TauE/SafE family protein [Bacilli bacterium]|nr:sulfite exporter TauE/SafE family protein [Bacilli bacterium]